MEGAWPAGRTWDGGVLLWVDDWDEPCGGGVRLWLCDRSGDWMLALDLRFAKPRCFKREFRELIREEECRNDLKSGGGCCIKS